MTRPPAAPGGPRPVLLTVAGTIPAGLDEAVAAGRRPRADYRCLATAMAADVVDVAAARAAAGRLGRLLHRVGGGSVLVAWHCLRRRNDHRTVFTDSEQVGLPYAVFSRLLRRRPRHVMIVHRISAGKKVVLHRVFALRRRIDHIVVYASSQRRFVIERLGYPDADVTLSTFMVDTTFWRDDQVTPTERARPMVCAVGQELRDYPTMVAAVAGLDVDVVLAAASPWSKREDTSTRAPIPPNVQVRAFDPFDLRQLYADAAVVVVPLQPTDFQAGITTILEAMAMGRPIVCTRTEGQDDTIVDGVTGLYVPPGDASAMRAAIERLLGDPELAGHLGRAARQWVTEHADIETYARRLALLTR